jgi:hypothetical protein
MTMFFFAVYKKKTFYIPTFLKDKKIPNTFYVSKKRTNYDSNVFAFKQAFVFFAFSLFVQNHQKNKL